MLRRLITAISLADGGLRINVALAVPVLRPSRIWGCDSAGTCGYLKDIGQ